MLLSTVSKRVFSTPAGNALEKTYTNYYLRYVCSHVDSGNVPSQEYIYQSRSPNQVSLPKPSRVAVKISSVHSPDFVEDVKILVSILVNYLVQIFKTNTFQKEHVGGISCVILSNITSANDVRTAVKVIRDRIQMHRIRLIVSIECAHGVKNIREILTFCRKNNFNFILSGILVSSKYITYIICGNAVPIFSFSIKIIYI